MGVLLIVGAVMVPIGIAIANHLKPEYPMAITLSIKGDKTKVGFKLFALVVVATLFFGNIYYLIYPSILIPYDDYKLAIVFSVQLSTALIGLKFFIQSISNTGALTNLECLERDIVLHGISETEIKLRLQSHLGYEINEFILSKITALRDLIRSIETLIGEFDAFKIDLQSIPEEYNFERDKRKKEYVSKLKLLLTSKDEIYGCLSNS